MVWKVVTAGVAVFLLVGCGSKGPVLDKMGTLEGGEPDVITVQHVLIGFKGSVPGKDITRSKEEAQRLAEDIYRRAVGGEDFDALVSEYSDDNDLGVYGLANSGVEPDKTRQIYARSDMVPAFGDVGFSLAVGEIGMAYYDGSRSKFGWHIIKRLR